MSPMQPKTVFAAMTLLCSALALPAEEDAVVMTIEAKSLLLEQSYHPICEGFALRDGHLELVGKKRGLAATRSGITFDDGIYEVTVVYRCAGKRSRARLQHGLAPVGHWRLKGTGTDWQQRTVTGVRLMPGSVLVLRVERHGKERFDLARLECRRVGAPPEPTARITRVALQGLAVNGPFCVAQLDGDPGHEVLVKEWRGSHHVNIAGPESNTHPARIYAFDDDGAPLWTADQGPGVEVGQQYGPVTTCDADGDGIAEVFLRYADDPKGQWPGKITDVQGQEWIVKLRGSDGKELARAPWPAPPRPVRDYKHNQRQGLVVACLDGERPALVAIRGYYGNVRIAAYTADLEPLWQFASQRHGKRWNGAAHFFAVGDVDGDGKDEIVYGTAVVDQDGRPLWTTGASHVDAALVGDIDPANPGLEVFIGDNDRRDFTGLVDGATGRVLWQHKVDVQKADIGDRLPEVPGLEVVYDVSRGSFSHSESQPHKVFDARGKELPMKRFYGHDEPFLVTEIMIPHSLVQWRGDGRASLLGRETPYGQYHGDVAGDWREEIFFLHDGVLTIYEATGAATLQRPPLRRQASYRHAIGGGSRLFSNAAMPVVTPTPIKE